VASSGDAKYDFILFLFYLQFQTTHDQKWVGTSDTFVGSCGYNQWHRQLMLSMILFFIFYFYFYFISSFRLLMFRNGLGRQIRSFAHMGSVRGIID
jgi:hypothetical protein